MCINFNRWRDINFITGNIKKEHTAFHDIQRKEKKKTKNQTKIRP